MMACVVSLIVSILAGFVLRMPELGEQHDHGLALTEPDVALDLTGRSGPVILTVSYRVALDQARAFYTAMLDMEAIRHRTGAYGWSLSRDVGDPELWVERYHTPTWHDYLRQRMRPTDAERALQRTATEMHTGPEPVRIRRMLERPFGSVRWKDDTPDDTTAVVIPVGAQATTTSGT